MFKKYLIVASKQDPAGINITTNLSQFAHFNYMLVDGEVLDEKNLDQYRLSQFDFIIFASRHKSEKSMKTLSLHAPGNLKEVWGGGQEGKLAPASALFNKQLFGNLKKFQKEYELKNYDVTLEVTHHGPLIDKPCVFIEIGGSETEWKDKRAAFVIAKTITETIENFKENPFNEVAIGIGGPHYAPGFNKLQENSNVAFAHIIPKYMQPITKEMILEAREKTLEEVDFAVIDWKGLGKAEERQQVLDALDESYISYKKISEIKR
jgi:D-aminoacyl-tRNA deacylase